MKLEIEWKTPVPLKRVRSGAGIYSIDLEELPREPCIYIVARKWSTSYEALYIGKSKRLRGRIRGHMNNLKLMQHIHEAKTGKRVLIYGLPVVKRGQKIDKILSALEKALIKHFLLQGHDIVNSQGTSVRRHIITSTGRLPRAFIPSNMYLERGRGE